MPRVTARTLALALAVASPATLLAQSPAADVPETHTVKQGDTLWGISKTYFNDPLQWPRLYQMNTSVVEDPHWIYPGEVLKLRSDVAITTVPTTVPSTDTTPASTPVAEVQAPDSASREAAVATTVPEASAEQAVADTTPIFPRMGMQVSTTNFSAEYSDNYRAVSRATFYQSGFLTEGKSLPLGTLLGITSPSQIVASTTGSAYPFSQVAIEPPAPGAYQVGDSLMVVTVRGGSFGGFGDAVQPIGIVRITDVSQPKLLGIVIQQYGQLSPGSKVLLAEKYVDRPGVRAAPVADGTEGTVINWRDNDVLRGVGDVAFIDKGKSDGMAIGDVIEVHRSGTINDNVPIVVPDVVARMQVTHVGDKTATTRITWVSHPDISAGTRWKLVARLPG